MNNKEIIKLLKLTVSLLELHDEDSFKIKRLKNTIFNLEKYDRPLAEMSEEGLLQIEGVGKSTASSIQEVLETGSFDTLNELLGKTPAGVIEMLAIKGIGAKKVSAIWKDLQITQTEDLLQACEEGRLADVKGFGEKSQEDIKKIIQFKFASQGKCRYAEIEAHAVALLTQIKENFPGALASLAGEMRRKMEVVAEVTLVVGFDSFFDIQDFLDQAPSIQKDRLSSGPFTWKGKFEEKEVDLVIRFCKKADFYRTLLIHTGSRKHLSTVIHEHHLIQLTEGKQFDNEEAIYTEAGMAFVPPELREGTFEIDLARKGSMPHLLEVKDLKGILHNHSTYSDGKNSLEEMAVYCKELGYEYLGIADHSKSAFYANGMDEHTVLKQHEEIDLLNARLAPFKILKGVESDILNDGSLDYDRDILECFDFIVASIHSNLKMDSRKATQRLLTAIANPYTSILGHPTGRLLLEREAYPIDHKQVIDACAQHKVVIEVNADPYRLDLDWRWIHYALDQGVLLSINPDAHEKAGYGKMYYGVCVARKGGLTPDMTLNCFSREEIMDFFTRKKPSR